MSFSIAELFVDLGIKGSDESVKKVKGVDTGLRGIASSGLAAKAMLVGVMYGMQRLMSNSAQAGASLTQFANLTGLSTDKLQRWQYAAKMSNVAAEDITGSIKGVQQAMARMSLGQGAPAGFGMMANTVGFDMTKMDDTFYVMDKLKEFAKSTGSHSAQGNEFLKSFGLSEGAIGFLRETNIEVDKLSSGLFYSEKGQKALSNVNAGFAKLGHNIEKSMGNMTAKYGPQLLKDLNMLIPKVLKLTENFAKLADQMKAFELIGMVFEGWALIFDEINKSLGGRPGSDSGIPSAGDRGMSHLGIPSTPAALKGGQKGEMVTLQNNVTINGPVDDPRKVVDAVTFGGKVILKSFNQNKAKDQVN